PDSLGASVMDALNEVNPALAPAFQALGSQALGSLSGFLVGELAQGLGLNGTSFADQLLRSVSGSLLGTVLGNISKAALSGAPLTTDNVFADMTGVSAGAAISGFLGGYLAHELVQPENQGGALGGALGSVLGSTLIGSVGAQVLSSLGITAALGGSAD